MKNIKLLFLSILLLSLTGCEDKKSESALKTVQKDTNTTQNNQPSKASKIAALRRKKVSFILSDINDTNHTISIENKHIDISAIKQEIIVLNFFATWCPPCKGEIPYLADLNKKYSDKVFMVGILSNDKPKVESLKRYMKQYGINYFVSVSKDNDALTKLAAERLQMDENFPLPLTILFKNGAYYSHYEGAVPIEMLEHDIKKAMHKE